MKKFTNNKEKDAVDIHNQKVLMGQITRDFYENKCMNNGDYILDDRLLKLH